MRLLHSMLELASVEVSPREIVLRNEGERVVARDGSSLLQGLRHPRQRHQYSDAEGSASQIVGGKEERGIDVPDGRGSIERQKERCVRQCAKPGYRLRVNLYERFGSMLSRLDSLEAQKSSNQSFMTVGSIWREFDRFLEHRDGLLSRKGIAGLQDFSPVEQPSHLRFQRRHMSRIVLSYFFLLIVQHPREARQQSDKEEADHKKRLPPAPKYGAEFRILDSDWGDKPVAAPRNRLNELRGLRIVAKGNAELANVEMDALHEIDVNVFRPQSMPDLIRRDDLT